MSELCLSGRSQIPGHGPALVCGSWRMARSPPAPWLLHFLSTERHIGEWQTCLNRAGRSPIPQSDATDYDPELVTSSSAYQARGPVLFLLLEREVHSHGGYHRDRLSIQHYGLANPLPDCIHSRSDQQRVACVIVGIAAALPLARLLRAFLFGITATDPLTFLWVSLTLVLVAAAACYRVSVDPQRPQSAALRARCGATMPRRQRSEARATGRRSRVLGWSGTEGYFSNLKITAR